MGPGPCRTLDQHQNGRYTKTAVTKKSSSVTKKGSCSVTKTELPKAPAAKAARSGKGPPPEPAGPPPKKAAAPPGPPAVNKEEKESLHHSSACFRGFSGLRNFHAAAKQFFIFTHILYADTFAASFNESHFCSVFQRIALLQHLSTNRTHTHTTG